VEKSIRDNDMLGVIEDVLIKELIRTERPEIVRLI